jgi:hypothetical protein
MADLTYNGVTISYVSTQQVTFDPVYDTLAQRDYLYTEVTIVANFVITPGAAPALPGETTDDIIGRISHLLNMPRRPLLYRSGLKTLIQIVAGPDANNGPLTSCQINRVVGTNSLMCSFKVRAFIVDCGGSAGPPYVSNRFSESVEINDLAMTIRNISGVLVARSDMTPNADTLRAIVVPPLEPQFRRIKSDYVLSPDGLRLSYTFRDEEQYVMPPYPAARAAGQFSVMTTNSAVYFGEFQLTLWSGKNVDKALLMRRAIEIGLAKMESAGLKDIDPSAKGAFVMTGSVSENLTANEVSVSLRAQVNPSRARFSQTDQGGGAPNPFQLFGPGIGLPGFIIKSINAVAQAAKGQQTAKLVSWNTTDSLKWLQVPAVWDLNGQGAQFDPGSRGSAQLLLAAAAMQDPCLRKSISLVAGQQTGDNSQDSGDKPADVSISSTAPDDKNALRTDSSEPGVYTRYMVDQNTTLDTNVFQMPVASPGEKPVIIQTGEAVSSRRVEWYAEKVGAPPFVPNPKSNDPNMVLKKAQVAPQEMGLAADGVSPIYRVKGCYDYIFIDPTLAFMSSALVPWLNQVLNSLRSAPFAFKHGIIDNAAGGPVMRSVGSAVGSLIGTLVTGGVGGAINSALSTSDNGQPTLSAGGGGGGGGTSSLSSGDGGFTDR